MNLSGSERVSLDVPQIHPSCSEKNNKVGLPWVQPTSEQHTNSTELHVRWSSPAWHCTAIQPQPSLLGAAPVLLSSVPALLQAGDSPFWGSEISRWVLWVLCITTQHFY